MIDINNFQTLRLVQQSAGLESCNVPDSRHTSTIKRLYDSENCAVLITDSSAKLLGREIATALRERTLCYEVFPLSFNEFLKFKGIKIPPNP
jgi:predicted AAA+ superfamily ATPase